MTFWKSFFFTLKAICLICLNLFKSLRFKLNKQELVYAFLLVVVVCAFFFHFFILFFSSVCSFKILFQFNFVMDTNLNYLPYFYSVIFFYSLFFCSHCAFLFKVPRHIKFLNRAESWFYYKACNKIITLFVLENRPDEMKMRVDFAIWKIYTLYNNNKYNFNMRVLCIYMTVDCYHCMKPELGSTQYEVWTIILTSAIHSIYNNTHTVFFIFFFLFEEKWSEIHSMKCITLNKIYIVHVRSLICLTRKKGKKKIDCMPVWNLLLSRRNEK